MTLHSGPSLRGGCQAWLFWHYWFVEGGARTCVCAAVTPGAAGLGPVVVSSLKYRNNNRIRSTRLHSALNSPRTGHGGNGDADADHAHTRWRLMT